MAQYEAELPVVRSAQEARGWFESHSSGSVICEGVKGERKVVSEFVEAERFFASPLLEVEHWTAEQWKNWVAKNCMDSYSLVVVLSVLTLFEAGVETEDEMHRVLTENRFGITGAQADMAIGFYKYHKVDGLPDKDMAEIAQRGEAAIEGAAPADVEVSTPESRLTILLEGVRSNPEKVAERFEDYLVRANIGSASPNDVRLMLVQFFKGYE